ncbi:MAG: DNA polymerase III subunit gamma/tau [Acidobacteria bacterium]|nr:DNA polymerase III subunit gamma/tau [Acidobacteriota bacterium]
MYQVIARTWRPQRFSEVIGQGHVTETLQNAIRLNRTGHGYIFSGQRGVGKTTVARLLAKALNCQQGPAPEPCGECDSCREIAAGRSVDVIEIDAASNRGIDAVRELRENVRYAPARDRYKIFIIDEAHQITPEGFNALLKTLEEPPPHVLFVLATTEVQEFPETILSRCQHFAFHAVRFSELTAHLERVCAVEKVEADPEALAALAGSAEGSIRDALSHLEQAVAAFGSRLEGPAVRRLLGTAPSQLVEEVFMALREQDRQKMLEVVSRLLEEGYQLPQFCTQLARAVRNLLVVRVAGAQPHLLECSPEERQKLAAWAEPFSEETLMRSLEILLELHRQVRYSLEPRFQVELGLLKLVDAERLVAIEELLARMESGTPAGSLASGVHSATSNRAAATAPVSAKTSGATPLSPLEQDRLRRRQNPEAIAPTGESSQKFRNSSAALPANHMETDPSVPQEVWAGEILRRLEQCSKPVLASLLSNVRQWEFDDSEVRIRLADNGIANVLPDSDRRLLAQLVHEVLGHPVQVRLLDPTQLTSGLSPSDETGGTVSAGSTNGTSVEERARKDPEVQEFERLFGKPVTGIRRWKG